MPSDRRPIAKQSDEELEESAWRALKGALLAIEELRRRRADDEGRIRNPVNPEQGITGS